MKSDMQLVFLGNASCVGSRSCRPDVGSETNASNPGYMQAVRDYIASDINGLFPTGMVGCALAYDLDRDVFSTDLIPVDMSLVQNGAGFVLGFGKLAFLQGSTYRPATRGRWSGNTTSSWVGTGIGGTTASSKDF